MVQADVSGLQSLQACSCISAPEMVSNLPHLSTSHVYLLSLVALPTLQASLFYYQPYIELHSRHAENPCYETNFFFEPHKKDFVYDGTKGEGGVEESEVENRWGGKGV